MMYDEEFEVLEKAEIAGEVYTAVEHGGGRREMWVHPVNDSRGRFVPYATIDEIRLAKVIETIGE